MDLSQIKEYADVIGAVLGVSATLFVISSKGRVWIKEKYKKFKTSSNAKKNIPLVLDQIYTKVDQVDGRLKKVEYEVSPNGNGSMRDKIALIQAEMEATVWLAPRPMFRTNSSGMNLFVNEAYCQLCSCSPDELMKLGWKSFVADEDQGDDFYNRWLLSAKSQSQFAAKLKIQAKHEYRGEWLVRIRPLGTSIDDYVWQGILYPSDEIAKSYAIRLGIPIMA
jgi:PAS domain-containing protein